MEAAYIYWLYLEPYTFIFRNEEKALVYNTLNSAYLVCPYTQPLFRELIDGLEDMDNGYCVPLSEKALKNLEVLAWIKRLCETFSGNVIPASGQKPFLLKPVCRIYNSIQHQQKDKVFSLGHNILENLNEINLFLPSDILSSSEACPPPYYKQFLHNYPFLSQGLSCNDYARLLANLSATDVSKVNLLNTNACSFFPRLWEVLGQCDLDMDLYVDVEAVNDKMCDWHLTRNMRLVICLSSRHGMSILKNAVLLLKDKRCKWNFIVENERDMDVANLLQEHTGASIDLLPYYNGGNMDFFKQFVYNTLEDLLAEPISKQSIFRRQTLNENFFGKLTILPSGEVYANMNAGKIGNVLSDPLAKLVYKEMTQSTAWFLTREKGICGDCINRYLCPSVSNYEWASGIMNMCHVRNNEK